MGKVELKIEIDADLLARAQAAGVAIGDFVDGQLRAALGEGELSGVGEDDRAQEWATENADAIKDHQARIAEFGPFGEDFRTW
ncbi:hypothetical protein BH11PSE2_BH11PSE2_16310 [soil metagenome]